MSLTNFASTDGGGTLVVTKSHANMYVDNSTYASDGKLSTHSASYLHMAPPDGWTLYTITFADAYTISSFVITVACQKLGKYLYRPRFTFGYYSGGAWTDFPVLAPTDYVIHVMRYVDPDGYADVERVRLYIDDYYEEGEGAGAALVYEIEAWGVPFEDSPGGAGGLRIYDGAETLTIALQDLDDAKHKLRFRGADNVTYGVPLVDTSHAKASAIRIYDGSSVKALAKIT